MKKKKEKLDIWQILLMVMLLLFSLTILFPLLHILARSLSDPAQSGQMKGLEILPRGLSLINYKLIFSNKNLVPSIFNSVFITVVGTALNIGLTITAAYVLTRPGLVGKKILMSFFIIMMLFDPGIVPEYMVMKKVGLMGGRASVAV